MIPDAFARSTIDREGEAGAAWLAELPAIVVHEPDAFAAWGGRGAVQLYERDDDRFAMLLERANPSTLSELADGDEIATAAGQLSRRLSIPAPAGLPRLEDQADSWADELHKGAADFPGAVPAPAMDAALAVVDELGRNQPDVLVHGDFHARNILRGEREPWLAVDPKGYVGDPAYDGATLLGPRALALIESADLMKGLRHELDVFAEAAELDRDRVRRWAHVRAVQAAFHGRRFGFGRARSGPYLDRIIALVDQLAVSWY